MSEGDYIELAKGDVRIDFFEPFDGANWQNSIPLISRYRKSILEDKGRIFVHKVGHKNNFSGIELQQIGTLLGGLVDFERQCKKVLGVELEVRVEEISFGSVWLRGLTIIVPRNKLSIVLVNVILAGTAVYTTERAIKSFPGIVDASPAALDAVKRLHETVIDLFRHSLGRTDNKKHAPHQQFERNDDVIILRTAEYECRRLADQVVANVRAREARAVSAALRQKEKAQKAADRKARHEEYLAQRAAIAEAKEQERRRREAEYYERSNKLVIHGETRIYETKRHS